MQTAFLIVNVLAAAALTFSASADFARYQKVLVSMARANVPESWLSRLGLLKAAGALGLLVGLWVPAVGAAAAIGVILFFIGAIVTHVRARWYSFGFPSIYLLLGTGSLVLRLAS